MDHVVETNLDTNLNSDKIKIFLFLSESRFVSCNFIHFIWVLYTFGPGPYVRYTYLYREKN